MGKTFDSSDACRNKQNEEALSPSRIKERARRRRVDQVDDYDPPHEATLNPRALISVPDPRAQPADNASRRFPSS
jgi:hypothetical protein